MGDARVGFALTGSFCTLEKAIRAMEETAREYPNMVPILSETTGATDTRFGRAADFRQAAEEICGHGAVESVRESFRHLLHLHTPCIPQAWLHLMRMTATTRQIPLDSSTCSDFRSRFAP